MEPLFIIVIYYRGTLSSRILYLLVVPLQIQVIRKGLRVLLRHPPLSVATLTNGDQL
jgi:hypothetical protein